MPTRRVMLVSVASLVLFVGFWWAANLLLGANRVPGPDATVGEAFATLGRNNILAARPELPGPGLGIHVVWTLRRVVVSMFLGCAIGLMVTVALRSMGTFGRALLGALDLPRVLPPLIFVPLSVFWISPGESSILFAGVAYVASAFALFARFSLDQAERQYGEFLAIAGVQNLRKHLTVLLPAALPAWLGALRLITPINCGIILVIEYFIGQVGLGKVLQLAIQAYDIRLMFASIFWIVVMVFSIDFIILVVVGFFRPDLWRSRRALS